MKKYTAFGTQLGESAIVFTHKAYESLNRKADKSGYPIEILEQVYARGHRSWTEEFNCTAEQFAFDRVNSFIAGGFAAELDEDLRKWFKEKWVRFDTKGNIKGPCAREEGEGKPKCRPLASARAMSKEERAKSAMRKRREDPVADRPGKGGKPIMVQTEETLLEKNVPTNPGLWAKAKAAARSKFDVYPSAYANGWAAKWYKSKGGGWKSVSEETDESLNEANPSLRPAIIRRDGQVLKGKHGESHSDVYIRHGVDVSNLTAPRGDRVEFLDHRGRFLERDAAYDYAKDNDLIRRTPYGNLARSPSYRSTRELDTTMLQKEELINELDEACWEGYKRVGMKKKGNRMVPNCVPVKENELDEGKVKDTLQKAAKVGALVGALGSHAGKVYDVGNVATHSDDPGMAAATIATYAHPASRLFQAAPSILKVGKLNKGEDEKARQKKYAVKKTMREEQVGGHEKHTTNPDLPSSRFVGSPELTKTYMDSTPYSRGTPWQTIKKTVREHLEEATYQGRKVSLNKPFRTPGGPKKSAVYVDPDGDGNAKIVRFGDPNLSIKKDQPARKRSYCARSSGQGNLTKKDSANYWSRRAWNCEETIKEVAVDVASPPAIYGQQVPGQKMVQRAAPRPTEMSGRASGRIVSQGPSMSAKPNVRIAPGGVQPSIERSWKTSGRASVGTGGGSMSATPKTSLSYSQGGVNVGKGMSAAKQTSTVVKGMAQAGREALTKSAPAVGAASRALPGVAGVVAGVAAPYAAKEVAKSYEKGHSQGLKPHDVGGEKASDVFKRMKEPSQGRSASEYEKQVLTPQKYETPKAAAPKVDAPTPPSRPDYFTRGQAFSAARTEKGGAGGEFSYGGKQYQTNVAGEKYVSKPTPTSVTDEPKTEGGKKPKSMKEALEQVMRYREMNELSVPAGTTGKRTSVSTPMVAVRMASGKIEKHPPGKSGSSGGGGNGAEE